MQKKKSAKNTNEGTEKKRRNLKRNRTRGHDFERAIVSELKDIGYTGCVTSRSESKSMDDKKIDIIDTENKLPCHIQAKATMNTPDYFGIEKSCPLKDKPFVIF